jgi:SnoaL-like domain
MTMFKSHAYGGGATLAAVALTLVSFVSLASSDEPTATRSALLSRAQIEDMLTDYYALFGGADRGFGSYYTENGVLDVNGIVRRGRKPIDDLYSSIPPDHGKINVIFTNLRIVVRGDTATYDLVWTEFMSETATAVPHILEQGRDHGQLVKRDVRWLFGCRVVTNDGGLPPALEKYYEQRGSARVCQ